MGVKSIFAVSAGCYSDYRVLFACDDKETAEACAAVVRECEDSYMSDASVEEFVIYAKGTAPIRLTTFRSEVILFDDGHAGKTRFWNYTGWDFDGVPAKRPVVEYCRAPILNDNGGYLRVYGASQEAVAKVTTERLASFTAGSWMPHRESKVIA